MLKGSLEKKICGYLHEKYGGKFSAEKAVRYIDTSFEDLLRVKCRCESGCRGVFETVCRGDFSHIADDFANLVYSRKFDAEYAPICDSVMKTKLKTPNFYFRDNEIYRKLVDYLADDRYDVIGYHRVLLKQRSDMEEICKAAVSAAVRYQYFTFVYAEETHGPFECVKHIERRTYRYGIRQ